MENLRKILFTDGMSDDGLIIITDAPEKRIKILVEQFRECIEDGRSNYNALEELKVLYYVKVVYDSEVDIPEIKKMIGWNESYDLSDYRVIE